MLEEKFINPYIFVNLLDKKSVAGEEGNLSGKISCSLYPRTPMFVPNTTNENFFKSANKEHKSFDFYSYNDLSDVEDYKNKFHEPVIPGSSIRGEVRSTFEALTNSCLSAINNEQILYKRMPNPGKLYILECIPDKEEYYLYEATKYLACWYPCSKDNSIKKLDGKDVGQYFNKNVFSEGQKVYFKYGKPYKKFMEEIVTEIYTEKPNQNGFSEGYILKGEPFGEYDGGKTKKGKDKTIKHHFSIAVINNDEKKIEISSRQIDALKENIRLYQNKIVNKNYKSGKRDTAKHFGYKEYGEYLNKILNVGGKIPIYFKAKGENLKDIKDGFLSPACISREVYNNTISDLLKQGNYNPCDKKENICPACKLFGFVSEKDDDKNNKEKNKFAYASRLRFTDALIKFDDKLKNLKDLFEAPIVLKELSSPKLSSTEFYLQGTDVDLNEFKIGKKDNPETKSKNIDIIKKGTILKWDEFKIDKPEPKQINLPKSDIWHYDFAFNWSGNNRFDVVDYTPTIKGRKFYWQHKNITRKDLEVAKDAKDRETIRNSTVRALKPCSREINYKFEFDVYFENLTQIELDKLIYSLSLGKDGYHSIGTGKPFGMGSSKITVDKVLLNSISIDNGIISRKNNSYTIKNDKELEKLFDNKISLNQVKTISKVHDFEAPIEYPAEFANGDIFKWFTNNKGQMNMPKIVQSLENVPFDDAVNLENKIALNRKS